ncbi:MAG: hypothetical protein M3372_07050, partial [Verrucomicrobiota bacterium]|nr:hypothetical protein [Verrucomicrobiota bacterium]
MKRILFALLMLAVVLPVAPKADARVDVSLNFFYDNLGSDGYWLDVDGYGYCWQPTVAVSNRTWRPYADGYWAYTDVGWTWVSYEPFGWATYHYGRWARLRNHGWVWVPGYEWGPSWVSWRTGGNYVGWAPLPPRRYAGGGEVVYSGRPISGYVDIEFDIGPSYYNFVDVRYIGAPVLSRHIYAPSQNVAYINQTVNVTNITYNNSTVYNYGPDYDRLSAYSTQPIQRLSLQRTDAASGTAAGQPGEFTKVQGDKLIVAAPSTLEKPAQPIAPPTVKTKVTDPDLQTGWADIADANQKTQIQEKMKKEDRKFIPPPEIAPTNPDALTAAGTGAATAASPSMGASPATPAEGSAAPGTGASPATAASPANPADAAVAARERGRGKGRDNRNQPVQPDAATIQDSAATPAAPDALRGRGRNKRGDVQPPQPQQPGDDAAPGTQVAPQTGADIASPPAEERRGRGKRAQQPRGDIPVAPESSAPAVNGAAQAAPSSAPAIAPADDRGANKKNRARGNDVPAPQPEREPIADVAPAPRVDRQPEVPPVSQPEERMTRGGGKKADRMEIAPAPQPAPEPPREVRAPRIDRMPRPAPPQQMAPPPD